MNGSLFRILCLTALCWFSTLTQAVGESPAQEPPTKSLEEQLEGLSVPTNQPPPAVSSEKIYSVQNRYSSLRHRSEISVGGAKNFTVDGLLVSQEVDLTYRFYLSDRWYLGLNGAYVFNSLSGGGQKVLDTIGQLPDVAYAKYRGDLTLGYHLFYGKFRLSMDSVLYFDQYVALGGGILNLSTGNTMAAVGDIGFVFWLGHKWSARLGMKDYFFREQRVLSSSMVNSLLAHLDIGFLFGGG